MSKIRLGVLISGGGSNMQAIIDQIEAGRLSAEIPLVLSNQAEAMGLSRARKHGLKNMFLHHADFPSRTAYDTRLKEILIDHQVDLVILAGFMRIITPVLIQAFPNQIMNIHPALLPSFPGTHVWGAQLEYGIKIAGCTVHFVDSGTDTGPIIIQAAVPVLEDDTAETLAARILRQEHRIYPRAIELFAQGRLTVEGRRVRIAPLDHVQEGAVLINPGPEDRDQVPGD